MIFITVIALAGLLGLSATFSMVESAVTALSALRMKKIVVLSPKLAPLFQEWLSKPHRLLTALMVGNNVVSIGFSSLAAVAAVRRNALVSEVVLSWTGWVAVAAGPAGPGGPTDGGKAAIVVGVVLSLAFAAATTRAHRRADAAAAARAS